MVDPEYIDDTPWYANKGIPLGIIIYLIIATISATAYLTNLADRIAFLEADKPTHDEISIRLTKIETILKKMSPDQSNH